MTNMKSPPGYIFHPEVARAIRFGWPVVSLESTVVTHGLPRPENLELARKLEAVVRQEGASPATIGVIDGRIHIGLRDEDLQLLAYDNDARKVSRRDFGIVKATGGNGGTTVAGTLIASHQAGILVFATGGIGGVHRNASFDISADLPELGRTPLIVVCAGAKSILDLPATIEVLETYGVPIIGYRTDEFPAFYSQSSGLPVNIRVETPQEVVEIARAQWEMGLENALLVVQPPPDEVALPSDLVDRWIQEALSEADQQHIHGATVTPFLLSRVSQLSGGSSLRANLALLENNARLAAQIAVALQPKKVI